VTLTDLAVGIAILVGLAGIIVPVLPGSILILGAILVWALEVQTAAGWVVFAIAATFLVVGAVIKFVVPRNRLREAGVPNSTLTWGAVAAVVGFFVIPYVGLFAGFVLGVYLAERHRVGPQQAWPSTKHALKAVGWSIAIELTAALLATFTWTVGVIVT
jgi:uncharacterized protein YqgC (DUF456 family)